MAFEASLPRSYEPYKLSSSTGLRPWPCARVEGSAAAKNNASKNVLLRDIPESVSEIFLLVLFSTTRGTSEVKQCSRLAGSAVPGNHDSPGARRRVLCGERALGTTARGQ